MKPTFRTPPTTVGPVRRSRSAGTVIVVTAALVGSSLLGAASSGASTNLSSGAKVGAMSARHSAAGVGYHCARAPKSAAMKPGARATEVASFGLYQVRYTSTVPTSKSSNYMGYGMPFPGSLRVVAAKITWPLTSPVGTGFAAIVQLCAIRFGAERHPEILVAGFTGGAHCCDLAAVYAYDAATTKYVKVLDESAKYVARLKYDPNAGFVPRMVAGRVVLETGDGSFAYHFGCYACTPMPRRLYSFASGRVIDVTAHFPSLVKSDAASLWQSVRSNESPASGYSGLFGSLAAWVAERCTIGAGRDAWSQVERLAAQGTLSDANYHLATFVTKGSYVPSLRRFLLANGYCKGQVQ